MRVEELLQTKHEEIIRDACAAVERAHLSGYQRSGTGPTEERLRRLLELTRAAIETRALTAVVEHAQTIARERFAAGFDLGEVQTAINVLEEAIWVRVLGEIAPAEQGEALGLVSTVLGATKDALARAYVSLASHGKTPSLDLHALFHGTQGGGQGQS